MEVRWIEWVRRLQAIAQNGLMFSKDPFDRERYEQVRSVAAEILASSTEMDPVLVHSFLQGEQGYATPKIDVRGAVFHENRLLFVRETEVARYTLWRAHTSIEESRQFIAWLTRVSMACWALVHSDSGHVIGTSFLHSYHLKNFRFVLLEKCGHTPWLERWAREGFYRIIKAELL